MLPISGVMLPAEGSSHQARGSTNFAHSTQKHGDDETNNTTAYPRHGTAETNDTSAPEKCTKNAHFSPAKAMAVSNHRASSPAAPTRSARGRRRDPISTHSHAIPPTHTSRLDTQSLKFQAIHRATNHRRQTTRQHARPHRCGGRRRPGCGARGRQQGLARQHTDTPDRLEAAARPAGPGRASRRRAERSSRRGRRAAGRPRGGRRSVGATSSPAPRSTTRPWGASTTRQRVGHLAAPHPSTPIVQQAITLSPAPRRG